jgi:hypothetical protein
MESKEKKIRRAPIIINKNAVALIHIFEKYDDFDDMWMSDFGQYVEENFEEHEKAAEQFIFQLKDEWCVAFMEKLIEVAFKTMLEEDSNAFTKEKAQKLIDKLQEITDKRKDNGTN